MTTRNPSSLDSANCVKWLKTCRSPYIRYNVYVILRYKIEKREPSQLEKLTKKSIKLPTDRSDKLRLNQLGFVWYN